MHCKRLLTIAIITKIARLDFKRELQILSIDGPLRSANNTALHSSDGSSPLMMLKLSRCSAIDSKTFTAQRLDQEINSVSCLYYQTQVSLRRADLVADFHTISPTVPTADL